MSHFVLINFQTLFRPYLIGIHQKRFMMKQILEEIIKLPKLDINSYNVVPLNRNLCKQWKT
ncbi:hypothetical protein WN943_022859 [Citrus x changshan-huyou]